jgi:hypothetical protein
MMGNGAGTAAVLEMRRGSEAIELSGTGATKLSDGDDDAYKMARTQKAQEEARAMRRRNALDEGTYVLASDTVMTTQRLLSKEVAQFENVMRQAARKVADEMGVDFKEVRSILVLAWREHRGKRSRMLADHGAEAGMSVTEKEADI